MIEILRDREYTVEQLCLYFGDKVSARDVQRDLKAIEESNLINGFYRIKGRPHRFRIDTPRNTLHPIETLALYSATRLVFHRARGHNKHYSKALRLIGRWLPDRIQSVVERSVDNVGNQRGSWESNALERVAQGWFEGRRLRFQYQSANGKNGLRTNVLEVYFIEVHPVNLGLYAVGLETSYHKKIRTFKLTRMRDPQVLHDTAYTIPDDFDPQAFFKHAWGVTGQSDGETITVRLRFSPLVARRLEEEGYQHMSLRATSDGGKIATIQAGVDATGLPLELLVWIRTWGANVTVLEPQALRERWLEDCREVLRQAGEIA